MIGRVNEIVSIGKQLKMISNVDYENLISDCYIFSGSSKYIASQCNKCKLGNLANCGKSKVFDKVNGVDLMPVDYKN